MGIRYTDSAEGIAPENIKGFFHGWPKHPTPDKHLQLLQQSGEVMLAVDEDSGNVVGFVTAVTDGVLAAYIPLLEVLPSYRRRGIAKELVKRMLERLDDYYMIDLFCDLELQLFYTAMGMGPGTGMTIRNFDRQAGRPDS